MSEGPFYDEVRIFVQGGKGGRGCVSFRHERGVPRGGPDGGNGGKGGSVILQASSEESTLIYYHFKKHFFAENGRLGSGNQRQGRSGADMVLPVPVGTVVKRDSGSVVGDLCAENQVLTVARGGGGGRGNASYKSATRQAPRVAEEGREGERRYIRLELKLLADIGIIGLPNAGKSTLLASISNARPKVAAYPFTTLKPHLGIVVLDDHRSALVADLPGLIEEASAGKGLGDRFLRHIERSKALLHLIDMSRDFGASAQERFTRINDELRCYSPSLLDKRQLVVGTKLDMPGAGERLQRFQEAMPHEAAVMGISCWTGQGLPELVRALFAMLGEDHGNNS